MISNLELHHQPELEEAELIRLFVDGTLRPALTRAASMRKISITIPLDQKHLETLRLLSERTKVPMTVDARDGIDRVLKLYTAQLELFRSATRGNQHPAGMRIIAFANQKGGVGKTTSTAACGHALAELGHRVLLIDLDPQSSLTISLGLTPASLAHTVYDLLREDDASPRRRR